MTLFSNGKARIKWSLVGGIAATLLAPFASAQHPDMALSISARGDFWGGNKAIRAGDQILISEPNGFLSFGWVSVLEQNSDQIWTEVQTLRGVASQFGLGAEMYSVNGRLAVAGDGGASSGDNGTVRIYQKAPAGDWFFSGQVLVDTPTVDGFGGAVVFSDDLQWLAVGAPESDVGGFDQAGKVFVFEIDPVFGGYVQSQVLEFHTPQSSAHFGSVLGFASGHLISKVDHSSGLQTFTYNGTHWVFSGTIPTATTSTSAGLTSLGGEGFAARGNEFIFWTTSYLTGVGEVILETFEWNGAWTSTQTITGIPALAWNVDWTTNNLIYLSTGNGTYRFSRASSGAPFQAEEMAKPWAFNSGPSVAFSADEIVTLALNSTDGLALVSHPGGDWIGDPVRFPNGINGIGASTSLSATGSIASSDNDVHFHVGWAPPGQYGYLLASRAQAITFPANSTGALVLGGSIGRFRHLLNQTDATGRMDFHIDVQDIPAPTQGVIYAHESWTFQAWNRDPVYGSAFTNGVHIFFL